MDEARDLHFKELGDAKYYFEQKQIANDDMVKKQDVKVDLNNAYVGNIIKKENLAEEEKLEKERMNMY